MNRILPLAAVLTALLTGCPTNVTVDPEGYKCDLNSSCPDGYQCIDFLCRKINTNTCGGAICTAPASVCTDANTLRTFSASCEQARCVNTPTDTTCATGCLDNRCRGTVDTCSGVTCDMPPADTCVDANTVTTYATAGTCGTDGGCQYAPTTTTCAGGCTNGHCVDLCAGKSCNSAPAATCDNASTLRTFAATGTCVSATGNCEYQASTMTCANGCMNGQCQNQNLCAGVTCTTPPASTCMGSTLRTFASTGTCNMGTGQCSYAPADMVCPSGQCATGACIAPSLTFSQVGPRLRFAVRALDVAPGSLGQLALAVGSGGQVAQWNGATNTWTALTPPSTTPTLNAVAFSSANTAWLVGTGRTVWKFTNGAPGTLSVVSGISSLAGSNFIAVATRGDSNVLVASENGGVVQFDGSSWSLSTFPALDGPFTMHSAYIDESDRERVVGTCGLIDEPCLLYRNPSIGNTFNAVYSTNSSNPGFTAVGPSIDVPTASLSDAFVGDLDSKFYRHNNNGTSVVSQSTSQTLGGAGIVGITGGVVSGSIRPVYVLTSSSPSVNGALYRLTRPNTAVVVDRLMDVVNDSAVMSPNEAAGVLVAETRTTAGVSNVFRRNGANTGLHPDEALDLSEDFSALTSDGTVLFAGTEVGDIAIRRSTGALEFRRGPFAQINDAEARNGTGVLVVGEVGLTNNGLVGKVSGLTNQNFNSAPAVSGVVFYSACRNSDAEGFAVGNGGAIFSVNTTAATPTVSRMNSGVTLGLNSVECTGAGTAVACGNVGTVLRYANGAWAPVSPALPSNKNVSCQVLNGAIYAYGDNAFFRLDFNGTAWVSLPAQPALKYLILRTATEGYITSTPASGMTDIYRFDGSNLTKLQTISGSLGGGIQVGAKVVYVGLRGLVVEGQ